MIYFIGGAPRTGKSLLSSEFIRARTMPSLSTDFLYDIDQVRSFVGFDRLGIIEKGELFYPILKRLVGNIYRQSEHCIIDGDVILPRHISELSKSYEVKACFIGLSETSLDDITSFGRHFNWPKYKIDNGMAEEVNDLAQKTSDKSSIIQSECKKYDQRYYNLYPNYDKMKKEALEFLTS